MRFFCLFLGLFCTEFVLADECEVRTAELLKMEHDTVVIQRKKEWSVVNQIVFNRVLHTHEEDLDYIICSESIIIRRNIMPFGNLLVRQVGYKMQYIFSMPDDGGHWFYFEIDVFSDAILRDYQEKRENDVYMATQDNINIFFSRDFPHDLFYGSFLNDTSASVDRVFKHFR